MSKILQIQNMLASDDNDCFLLHALGLEYLKINDTENAIFQFKKVLTVNQNYVGTYYHLAKTYEAVMQTEAAIATYEKGMEIAKAAKDNHAYNELRSAYEELTM